MAKELLNDESAISTTVEEEYGSILNCQRYLWSEMSLYMMLKNLGYTHWIRRMRSRVNIQIENLETLKDLVDKNSPYAREINRYIDEVTRVQKEILRETKSGRPGHCLDYLFDGIIAVDDLVEGQYEEEKARMMGSELVEERLREIAHEARRRYIRGDEYIIDDKDPRVISEFVYALLHEAQPFINEIGIDMEKEGGNIMYVDGGVSKNLTKRYSAGHLRAWRKLHKRGRSVEDIRRGKLPCLPYSLLDLLRKED